MSISGDSGRAPSCGRTVHVYLLCAAAVGAFSMVYELFSHGVWSGFMVFAYMLPLCGGALVFLLLDCFGLRVGRTAFRLYNSGLAALTAGCLFRGVLDIYGTTSRLTAVYLYAGLLFLLLAAACFALEGAGRPAK